MQVVFDGIIHKRSFNHLKAFDNIALKATIWLFKNASILAEKPIVSSFNQGTTLYLTLVLKFVFHRTTS